MSSSETAEKTTASKSDESPEGGTKPCRVCHDFKTWMKMKMKATAPVADEIPKAEQSEIEASPERRDDCPLDKDALGRGTWGLLHTMVGVYADSPTQKQQEEMKQFLTLFSQLYPCHWCADDLRKYMSTHPLTVQSQSSLSQWMCNMHNDVNQRMNKPIFDCNQYNQRWRHGWKDGSCG